MNKIKNERKKLANAEKAEQARRDKEAAKAAKDIAKQLQLNLSATPAMVNTNGNSGVTTPNGSWKPKCKFRKYDNQY